MSAETDWLATLIEFEGDESLLDGLSVSKILDSDASGAFAALAGVRGRSFVGFPALVARECSRAWSNADASVLEDACRLCLLLPWTAKGYGVPKVLMFVARSMSPAGELTSRLIELDKNANGWLFGPADLRPTVSVGSLREEAWVIDPVAQSVRFDPMDGMTSEGQLDGVPERPGSSVLSIDSGRYGLLPLPSRADLLIDQFVMWRLELRLPVLALSRFRARGGRARTLGVYALRRMDRCFLYNEPDVLHLAIVAAASAIGCDNSTRSDEVRLMGACLTAARELGIDPAEVAANAEPSIPRCARRLLHELLALSYSFELGSGWGHSRPVR